MGRRACTELSACTVELYLYFPYGPYGLYRAQCLYKGALYTFYFITAKKEKSSLLKTTVTKKHREVVNPHTLRYTRVSVRLCYVPHSAYGASLFSVVAVCFSKDPLS
jgi:hypothetical protein